MPSVIDIEEFLSLAGNHTIIDVRSPLEYKHGHIPGAINIPLFSDEERAIVGTIHNSEGQERAMLKALELIGPSLSNKVLQLKNHTSQKKILLYCWRGGMRSSSMAWLFELFGFEAFVLKNGYKAFRRYAQIFFGKKFKLILIGGMTGSGKTYLLEELNNSGWQVLNLEKLASHKGSAFGSIGMAEQPTCEQFENELFSLLSVFDISKPIIVEDESFMIGKVQIPAELFNQMQNSLIIEIEISKERRVNRLINEYTVCDKELLKYCIEKISKRLGSADTKSAIFAVENNDFGSAANILLKYYDKRYIEVMNKRQEEKRLHLVLSEDSKANISLVQNLIRNIYGTD
jgi:tRNA 2-selenouridine synthase